MALFVLGFSLGSALLTAITGLNQEAKTRYSHSSALIENPVTHIIQPLIGQEYLPGELWLKLRKNGFTNAQPILRGRLTATTGQTLNIQGINSLLWLQAGTSSQQQKQQQQELVSRLFDSTSTSNSNDADYDDMSFDNNANSAASPSIYSPLTTLFVDSQFTQRLATKTANGDATASSEMTVNGEAVKLAPVFELNSQQAQPLVKFVDGIGLWAITDLALADHLLDAQGQLSFIELSELTRDQISNIEALIAGQARLVQADQQNFDVLSGAFFFNLTALALLGYVVAAFLSYNAIKLTMSARKKLLNQLYLLGCSKKSIQVSLIIELVAVSVITALIGAWGGYLIANALVLDVNRTLMGLYQLEKALVVNWQWTNVAIGFVLNVSALAFMLISQIKGLKQYRQKLFIALLLLTSVSFLWLFNFADTKFQALLLCFAILVMFILLVPRLLNGLSRIRLSTSTTCTKHPLIQWLHGDTKQHISDLTIAIVAILVALGSAIGMQIMVTSFSKTLNAHLEKQLSADIYLRTDKVTAEFRAMLSAQPEVKQVSVYFQSDGEVQTLPAKLASFGDSHLYYQHISLTSGKPVNISHFAENGCLANEQASIRFGIKLGDRVHFKQNAIDFPCRISGFFYDYGNPLMSFFTLEARHQLAKLSGRHYGYSIRLAEEDTSVELFSERLINEFNQDSSKILPNKRFKQFANALFENTFVVTKALNAFILAIALLSLCTSLLSLGANQRKQLVILNHLGVTQRQLLIMKLLQTSIIVLFTVLFALPLGLALGVALLKFVMPIAFGWTIHFHLDSPAIIQTCLLLMVAAMVCAYLPLRQLAYRHATRRSPSRSLGRSPKQLKS
ncbi:ABC transporter permease [Thalassotalea euphylliae]|uniref:ABC transporter permease n=2 Tax=Thalassotalea euphylliae TaxID=1655234 RepID=A0A3E0UKG4_9GAMM|nr:ABC transporter permease [Thalassotalea euphylliae]